MIVIHMSIHVTIIIYNLRLEIFIGSDKPSYLYNIIQFS